ncbi:MAG: GNAT family N-acetyltransferase [Planctomycetota bacterium]
MLDFLDGEARDGHVELARNEWHQDRTPTRHSEYVREVLDSSWARSSVRVPALRDASGAVVASLTLYDLAWRLGSRRLRLGGIGTLVVRPDLRKLGLGTRLLKAVHHHLVQQGFDGAVLFSGIGREFYERLGYAELPVGNIDVDCTDWEDDVARRGLPAVTLRDYEPDDFDAVRELYNHSSSLQKLAVLRPEDYWQHRLGALALRDEHFSDGPERHRVLVAEIEGEVTGYLIARLRPLHQELTVLEYGFRPEAPEHLTALVAALLGELDGERREAPRVRGVVPSRFGNLCPQGDVRWRPERDTRLMLASFSDFLVPAECGPDDRHVWGSDRF